MQTVFGEKSSGKKVTKVGEVKTKVKITKMSLISKNRVSSQRVTVFTSSTVLKEARCQDPHPDS
jgi:hypothetical protein